MQGRGAGIGNELIPWARAYLMAEVLQARCLNPAFGLNTRNYRLHFGTSRFDFVRQRLMLMSMPRVHFDEAAFEAHGGVDTSSAFTCFAHSQGLFQRQPLLVTTDGMWGGLQHVARARNFVRSTLYNTRFAAKNLSTLGARLDPNKLTVAMHVRLGDFTTATPHPDAYRGRFNSALPMEWFMAVGRNLLSAFGEKLQFQLFSDGTSEQLAPLILLLEPVNTQSPAPSDISDLLAMSQADLLVCSVSSYSIWAAVLSSSPYIWFEPQMHIHDKSWVSIWGGQPSQQRCDSATLTALAAQMEAGSHASVGRGYAVGIEGVLPESLLQAVHRRGEEVSWRGDLVRGGVAQSSKF